MGSSYNPNDPGRTLEGIAGLVQGISSFRDPDKKKREDLLRQLQQNPDLAQKLAQQLADNPNSDFGVRNARFGPSGSNVTDYLRSVPLDQSYHQRKQMETLAPRAEDGQAANPLLASVGAPGIKGPALTEDQQRQYDEFKSKSIGIKSKGEAAAQAANTKESLARAEAFKSEVEKRDEGKAADLAADAAIANSGADTRNTPGGIFGLVSPAVLEVPAAKKFDAQTASLFYKSPKYAKQLDDERNSYFANKLDARQREIHADNIAAREQAKNDTFVNNIVASVQGKTGKIISPDAVKNIMKHPDIQDSILTEKPEELSPEDLNVYHAVKTMKEIRDKEEGKLLMAAHSALSRDPAYKKVLGINNQKGGNKLTQEDIDELNARAAEYYSRIQSIPTPRWTLTDKHFWQGKDKAVPVATQMVQDPKLKDLYGAPEAQKGDFDSLPQEQKAQAFEAMRKKYPGEDSNKIVARLKKGEK